VKRWLDICLTLAALPLVVPLLALLWLWVRRDGGPGFYRQARIGRNGQRFTCWKLRTMCLDADTALSRLLAHDPARALEWSDNQKLQNDPRVTRTGRWLRACSLDELPQLWCVLRGEMSLVGPRPFMPNQLHDYLAASGPDRARAYLAQRPGLTGLWQVEGRGGTDFAARARFDQRYASALSLRADLLLLLRTIGVVCRRTGQ
jgi:lipopolysaccharide/colanic/teichoic acid biosynthesis glycosyltransferase